jgi:hypothetical protein
VVGRNYACRVRRRTVLAGLLAFAVLAVGGIYLVSRSIGDIPLTLPVAHPCVVGTDADERVSLGTEQVANAATIAAVGLRRGVPRRAVVVALATAWQESELENLAGGDRDSIGLFQQRPSQGWGRPEQISDPRYAAGRFYTALLKVPGWQEMRVTDAAQAVQRSAYPEAYEKWAARSEVLARALVGEATGAVGCTVKDEPEQRGSAAAEALVKGLRLDWGEVTSSVQPAAVVSVTARSDRAGWQYAHWIVAHSTVRGVHRVRFAGQEWTASSGKWTKSSPEAAAAGNKVLAEVHA